VKRFLKYSLDGVDLGMTYLFSIISIFYIMHLFGLKTEYILLLTLGGVLLFTYCFRLTIPNLIAFLIAHMALIAVIILSPLMIITKSVTALYAIVLFISSMRYFTKLRNSVTIIMPLGFELLFIICMLHNISPVLTKAAFLAGILYAAAYLLRTYLMNMNVFYLDGCATDYIPIRSILKRNSICTCSLIAILLAVSLCLQSDKLSSLLTSIGQSILSGFAHIVVLPFSFLPKGNPNASPVDGPESGNYTIPFPDADPNPIVEFIGDLLFFILEVVVLCGFLALLIYSIYSFFKKFMHADAKPDLKDSDSSILEFKEKIVSTKKPKEKEDIPKGDLRKKVRFLYKKRIHQLQKKGYQTKECHTPFERADEIAVKMNVDVHALTKVYEQARYSCEPIHKNDISNL